MELDPIKAIQDSRPPVTDYLTYLTILESHLSAKILPQLHEILQDEELVQNIGWDLIHLLLPIKGSESCLFTIARLGNPREAVLKVTESLQLLPIDEPGDAEEDASNQGDEAETAKQENEEPTNIEKFCTLIGLLSILLPRIKTKYPSRFLSTSLIAVLRAFRPSAQAALSVITFVQSLSGIKRPQLPSRKSDATTATAVSSGDVSGVRAPDPEAQEEDPREAAIQKKLLQSFVTYILEDYINENPVEWAPRLLESFDPSKVVVGKKSLAEAFKVEPDLQMRDTVAGQLLALSRDLELLNYDTLFETIYKEESETEAENDEEEEHYPSSPEAIPLSPGGCLFLVSSMIFSSILFESKSTMPSLSIFPDHEKLVKRFIGTAGPPTTGSEPAGIIDAVAAIGLWLEHNNKFVSGPLEDDDFLQHLQSLSLLSANSTLPTLRYACHVLTSSILHAHPDDRVRLAFITDTLEHCPYETLKESAIGWLKDELITAQTRKSDNVFSSSAAITAVVPYLFPETPSIEEHSTDELIQELMQGYPLHMGILNFLYFLSGKVYSDLVPSGLIQTSKEAYVLPLQEVLKKCLQDLEQETPTEESSDDVGHAEMRLLGDQLSRASTQVELQLLSERLALYLTKIQDL
ncbi:YAP-binding/ALF4/Glomulin [Xylogone sp. PMI_703]|nr:YAP-binding/ALF4/Glomulin [Xylogone sp. PMI_703]